jgi:NifB/MoaA-like Fe-S oxidoreductase
MPELIKNVEPGSPAQHAGIIAGDMLLSVNGKIIRDVLDYKFHTYEPRLSVDVERLGKRRRFKINKCEGEDLGLIF